MRPRKRRRGVPAAGERVAAMISTNGSCPGGAAHQGRALRLRWRAEARRARVGLRRDRHAVWPGARRAVVGVSRYPRVPSLTGGHDRPLGVPGRRPPRAARARGRRWPRRRGADGVRRPHRGPAAARRRHARIARPLAGGGPCEAGPALERLAGLHRAAARCRRHGILRRRVRVRRHRPRQAGSGCLPVRRRPARSRASDLPDDRRPGAKPRGRPHGRPAHPLLRARATARSARLPRSPSLPPPAAPGSLDPPRRAAIFSAASTPSWNGRRIRGTRRACSSLRRSAASGIGSSR